MAFYVSIIFFMLSLASFADSSVSYELCWKERLSQSELASIQKWISEKSESTDENILYMLADCSLGISNFDKAKRLISKVIEINENYPLAFYMQGKILYFNKEYQRAIVSFRKSIDNGFKDVDNYRYLARSYVFVNKIESAIKLLKSRIGELHKENIFLEGTVRFSLDEVYLYMLLSEIQYSNGDVDDAILTVSEGLERNKVSLDLFDTLVYLQKKKNNTEVVEELIEHSCETPGIQASVYCD